MGMTNALNLPCGLALFLYGMHVMGEGLTRASGGKLESILENITKSKIKAVLLGAGVTAIIQSSSATTVMVVGFVNSGLMTLAAGDRRHHGRQHRHDGHQHGCLSLDGHQRRRRVGASLSSPASFTPVLALIGIVMLHVLPRSGKKNDTGMILLGFATLMFGMETMSRRGRRAARMCPQFTTSVHCLHKSRSSACSPARC